VPLQPPPDHDVKSLSGSAEAVSVIGDDANVAEQVTPHEMPATSELTLPVPVPAFVTLNVAVPVPVSALEAPPPGDALTVREADFAPTEAGAKRTPTVQLAPAPSGVVQPFDEIAKLAVSDTLRVRAPVTDWPLFVIVNCVALLIAAIAVEPKSLLDGEIVSAPIVSAEPVTDAMTLPPGVALTVSVAGFDPDWPDGAKRTLAVQLAPTASVPVHVLPATA